MAKSWAMISDNDTYNYANNSLLEHSFGDSNVTYIHVLIFGFFSLLKALFWSSSLV